MSKATSSNRSSAAKTATRAHDNPFLKPWRTPFGLPPFDKIKPEHFPKAFAAALKSHKQNIKAIAANEARPSFANTIVALDKCDLELERVVSVFFNLTGADTNAELQAIERDIAPKLAAHHSAVFQNAALFKRVEDVFNRREKLKLEAEQRRLLERCHIWFLRAGAKLNAKAKKRVAQINQRLAELTAKFMQNVQVDEQSWHMELKGERDLAGLPAAMRSAARQTAIDLGLKDKAAHAITLARPSVEGFLTFSTRRDLREQAFNAWARRGEMGGKTDNRGIVAEVARLRVELANLFGFDTYAEYALEDTMAKTPQNVNALLNEVWSAAVTRANDEREALAARARSERSNHPIEAWDWRHFAENERKARFDIDDSQVRSYLQLENIIEAAFDTANKLFGLRFKEVFDVPLYHGDVRVFEVTDKKGEHIALFLGDYFARPSKRSGAWMSAFRSQHKLGRGARPIILNVLNCTKAPDGEPTLMSFDDARTLFHEFGHALHGMLSNVTYPGLSGTSVSRDFVELPSQLYEHWIMSRDVLKRFATHVDTGKPMPATLLKRLEAARNFNQGFATVEYTASAIVDMQIHSLTSAENLDTTSFEKKTLNQIAMPPAIIMRHRLPHFMHIMGGYQAGYYSYLWSEVMDADAFAAFEEEGDIFSPKVARRLKKHIYSAGNRRDPEDAYKAFRGRAPDINALLKKRGFA